MPVSPMERSGTLVMGIVNATPDSFSDGGRHSGVEALCDHALGLVGEGADIIDIGGESTRPGAEPVSVDEELERVVPVIEGVRRRSDVVISVDTLKPEVARVAVDAGACMWNDVSALSFGPDSLLVAAELGVEVILMHKRGDPATMQDDPEYGDVVAEVAAYLEERVAAATAAGVKGERIWIDPGIGFGKHLEDNLALMRSLSRFAGLAGGRLVVGASRKRFIYALDRSSGDAFAGRLGGSLAAAVHAVRHGARMLRVHDVSQTRQALAVTGWLEGRSA